MNDPSLSKMSPEEFDVYRAKKEEEADYQQWCEHTGHDPSDEIAKETYIEYRAEYGPAYWDTLDTNDREGTEHNITKDLEG